MQVRSNASIDCLEVVLGKQGLVVKTSSGKVSRLKCRQQYVDGSTPKGIILYRDRKVASGVSGQHESLSGQFSGATVNISLVGGSDGRPPLLPRDPSSTSFIPQKICVVGAGPAGLAAATSFRKWATR